MDAANPTNDGPSEINSRVDAGSVNGQRVFLDIEFVLPLYFLLAHCESMEASVLHPSNR